MRKSKLNLVNQSFKFNPSGQLAFTYLSKTYLNMKNILVEETLLNKIFFLHDKESNYLILFRKLIKEIFRLDFTKERLKPLTLY